MTPKICKRIVPCALNPSPEFQVSAFNLYKVMAISPPESRKTANFPAKKKQQQQLTNGLPTRSVAEFPIDEGKLKPRR